MAISDEVLAQINQLLNRLNAPEKKGITFSGIFRHPIVITVVGSALIAYASNFITKEFQLRDKQSNAVATLQSEFPRELALTTYLATILSVLEAQGCENEPNKKLVNPYVLGLTGKTCKDAEAEYLKYYKLFLEHPQGSSLVQLRALFSSPAVDDGATKLGALVGVLSVTSNDQCIAYAQDQANQAYEELVDLTIQEIDGKVVKKTPSVFELTDLPKHCLATDLCRVPAITKDHSVKVKCA